MCLQTQLSTLCSVIPEMYLSTSPMYHHIYIQVYRSIYNIVSYIYYIYIYTQTNISPKNCILKMIFLFPRWDMLIPWRVYIQSHSYHFNSFSLFWFYSCSTWFWSKFARKGAFRVTGALQVAEHWAKVRCNKKIPRKPMASLEEHCSYGIVIIMIYKWLANICWSSKWLTNIVI